MVVKDIKPVIFIVIVLILTAISAYPQRKFSGLVTEVIDGKTFVIQLPNGRITAVLQYIETPEPAQPLHQTVREHLEKMILDQPVEFQPRAVIDNKTVGQLFLKGVDISQQMLRDGAAWYAVAEKNGQTALESTLYQDNEAQARAEKRGVWGIDDLKPAWEFRAEKEAEKEEQKRLEYERNKAEAVKTSMRAPVRQPTGGGQSSFADFQTWSDVRSLDSSAGIDGLIRHYDNARQFGYFLTSQAQIAVADPKKAPYLDFRLAWFYQMTMAGKNNSVYLVAVLTDAEEYKFIKSNGLTVFADKQKIELGNAVRFYGDTGASKRETLIYKINRSDIIKIANAKDLQAKVGAYSGKISEKLQTLAKNLLNSAE